MLHHFFFSQHLDDEEEIVLVVHKHWLMGMRVLFWPTLLFLTVWGILLFSPNKYMVYGVALTTCFILIWWIRNFMDYFLDAWLITNKGIVDLEWHGWFHRKSARLLYSDLQGVSYEINGIFGMIFRYGHMDLEKVSTGTTIGMDFVSQPRRVEATILKCMETYMHKKNLKDAKTVQGILAEFVASSLQKQSVEAMAKPKKKV